MTYFHPAQMGFLKANRIQSMTISTDKDEKIAFQAGILSNNLF